MQGATVLAWRWPTHQQAATGRAQSEALSLLYNYNKPKSQVAQYYTLLLWSILMHQRQLFQWGWSILDPPAILYIFL
jgi:hypothetical protein